MKEAKFNLLNIIEKNGNKYLSQREIAERLSISLGKVNSLIAELKNENLLSEDISITEKGYKSLEPYKVQNAVIMAAGMSSRFAPLSYESPKGLLIVKGEKLIERQIKQLQEVGINDITLVVGYMKEKMFYLEEKFNVNIVINSDYNRYNNSSSLKLVTHKLANTYICSSDNYFVENPFEKYVYHAYYSCVFEAGSTEEYCVSYDKKNRILDVTIGGKDSWTMLGHVYFDKNFSDKFVEILNNEYKYSITKEKLWEDLYIRYIKDLDLSIRKYDKSNIKEFDSLEDLRSFDEKYINNANSDILRNICKVLDCKESDIVNIKPIQSTATNTSFKFKVLGKNYVYRHPDIDTELYINRASEVATLEIAKKLEIDKSYIYVDKKEGWKLAYFMYDTTSLDYKNKEHVSKAIKILKKLHNSSETTSFEFNIWHEIDKLKKHLSKYKRTDFNNMSYMEDMIAKLKVYLENKDSKKTLCNINTNPSNFIIDKEDKMYLIDWEYSGMADPALDLGTFISCSDFNLEEVEKTIADYLEYKPSGKELGHFFAYISVMSFYWFLWAINQENKGKIIGEYLYTWYKFSNFYGKKALEVYKKTKT
ncbi:MULTISPECIES: NTP transferase domain-containing protein [unclassified Gemella]|uniref:NTP transferase domain-containing protein n=1 Tax=unclassified Gemella TaxID=2624949 RepID=UPI001C04FB74|nr:MULTISPECIES: NTP transferase domain-containing protein [unclassified Gemella]MBU0279243.1 NTP transferase domain-containing protein [Gemella sp. zg-1178]QWQ39050.1 NTP transferase domain-containing protein [Gemella sp. zg-570]